MENGRLMLEIIRCELLGVTPDGSDLARLFGIAPQDAASAGDFAVVSIPEGVATEAPTHEALAELYRLAVAHDMAHIVGDFLQKRGLLSDDDISQKYLRAQMLSVYRYERMRHELSAIGELFESNGIAHIPLKGSVVREYYPTPHMRQSGDIDILVIEEKLDLARELLTDKLGFTVGDRGVHDIALTSPSGVLLELHFKLFDDELKEYVEELSGVWERATLCEGCHFTYRMSDADFYFHHIAHMAKHFLHGGCGIRPITDIFVMKRRGIDISICRAALSRAELLTFAEKIEALSSVWFSDAEHTSATEEIESFIMSGGVFGNVKNRVAVNERRRGGKLGYILSRLIVPRDKLEGYYPILKKYPILLPFGQVCRWFRVIRKKRRDKSRRELAALSKITDEEKNYISRLLETVGLK